MFASRARAAALGTTSLALAGAAVLGACDLGTITVPTTVPSIVVHAVLNTSASSQIVLLERTLNGTVVVNDTAFDASDPIVSGGGIPIDTALVEVTDSTGRTFVGVEDNTLPINSGRGQGVYRLPLPGTQLVAGGRYRLHIRTAHGEEVTAFTRVPRAEVTSFGGITRTFNRDHDTLRVAWNRVADARTYTVRIESPFGPFFLFTDSLSLAISGELRNPFADKFQRVFIPGFRQDALVAAVDSNFYDYYRTNNDPFTGSGIISRVQGGVGLFGAIAVLNTGTLNVVADQTDSIEGRFRASTVSPQVTFANRITLYVESRAARADLPDALSGQYQIFGTSSRVDGIIGQRSGQTVVLAFLRNQQPADTADVFVGKLIGDSLTGAYRDRGGPAVFKKFGSSGN